MSAAQPGAVVPAAGAEPETDPGERGSLTIAESVLVAVAEHAADLVEGTARAPRSVAGVGVGSTGARIKAAAHGDGVDLRVEVALRYPGGVRAVVDELRRRVAAEVERITGRHVRSVAVTVTALLPAGADSSSPRVE